MYPQNKPLHERVKPLGLLRKPLREGFFRFLEKIWQTDDARQIASDALKGILNGYPDKAVCGLSDVKSPPYPELGQASRNPIDGKGRNAVIITARFRTGSTLLWNLFRNIPGITAYYEPFNERRWFDPESRGDRLDATHRGVSDYWREYARLGDLASLYREEWTYRHLFMGENFWNPQMKRYIEVLIEKAAGRPVLQFNRVDFRLPWIKHNFPRAKVIHLYRNPRDQWCSSLMDLHCVSRDATIEEFRAHDKFYLMNWATDLKYHFPFLDEKTISHPYELFYYIWKLSYLFGIKYADHSIRLEALVENLEAQLVELFRVVNIENGDIGDLKRLVTKVDVGKWREYADDEWFKNYESGCEEVLWDFLGPTAKSCS